MAVPRKHLQHNFKTVEMFRAQIMDFIAARQLYTFEYDLFNLHYIHVCDARIGKCYTS